MTKQERMKAFEMRLDGIRDLSKLQSEHLRIRINGQTVEGEYIFGIVASSSSLAGAMDFFGQKVVADDGLFEVLLLRRPTSPAELQSTIAALSSQELNNELITFCRTDKIELECMKKLNWALDGEKCREDHRCEVNIESETHYPCRERRSDVCTHDYRYSLCEG